MKRKDDKKFVSKKFVVGKIKLPKPEKLLAGGVDTRGFKEAGKRYDERQREATSQAKNVLKAKEAFFKQKEG